jgi:methyl-accepting chemotaxis protein
MAKQSIKRKILLFTLMFFPVIFIAGSITFVISMWSNAHANTGYELAQRLVLERIKLEASVESEIAIALKMASSPIIQLYFANPRNAQIAALANEEIASYRRAFASNIVFWINDIDKNFWYEDKITHTLDPSDPDNYWYNLTMRHTEKYNFNINYNPDLDVTNLWINAPVFDSQRKSIGVIGTGVNITTFIDSIYEDFTSRGELYFFNSLDEITGARDTSLVLNKVSIRHVLGDLADEVLSRVKVRWSTLHTGEIQFIRKPDSVTALGQVPSLGWYIIAVLPITVSEVFDNTMTYLFAVMMAVILGIFIAFYIFITRLLHRTTSTADRVFESLENNDLSVEIDIQSDDELGSLLTALDIFLAKLRSAFAKFNENASMVSSSVHELSSSAKQVTTTANEQSASVAEIVSTMENNKDLSVQVSSNTSEVAHLAEETKELSRHGAALHSANEKMMLDIKDKNAKILEEINNLHEVLSRIDESVEIIDTIADKTKLIAFNAALEASSSGEAGLRFAVVASEIRRFADNVVESVHEIKERITELQNASSTLISEAAVGSKAIDSGYNRMVEQREVYENIVDVSQNVADRSQQISSLSKQQEQVSEQVFTTLKEISAGVKQFVTATVSTSATAENLNAMSLELKDILARYRINK